MRKIKTEKQFKNIKNGLNNDIEKFDKEKKKLSKIWRKIDHYGVEETYNEVINNKEFCEQHPDIVKGFEERHKIEIPEEEWDIIKKYMTDEKEDRDAYEQQL